MQHLNRHTVYVLCLNIVTEKWATDSQVQWTSIVVPIVLRQSCVGISLGKKTKTFSVVSYDDSDSAQRLFKMLDSEM